MADQELFIIVNIAELEEDPKTSYEGMIIPDFYKPSYIHLNRQSACDELLRLSREHTEGKFVLFDAILFTRRKHTLDHGLDMARCKVFEIAPIEELSL